MKFELKEIIEFVKKNREKFIAGGVVVGAVFMLIVYGIVSHQANIVVAQERLGNAMALYSNNQFDDALNQLNEVLKFKGTKPYEFAVVFKADILIRKGVFDEAINMLQKFKPSNKYIKPLKIFLLAKSYDFKNENDMAIEYYSKFINEYPDHHLNPDAIYSLAKVYLRKQDFEHAKENFEKIITLYPRSIWEALSRMFLPRKQGT